MNRLNVICLGVKDMGKAIKFYKDGLGFQTNETSYTPPVIFFNATAGLKLELYPLDLLAKDINNDNPPPIKSGFSGFTLAYNAKSKEEVHQIIELAKKQALKSKKNLKMFFGEVIMPTFQILMVIIGKWLMVLISILMKIICLYYKTTLHFCSFLSTR